MQRQKQVAGIFTVVATAVLAVLRLFFPPQGNGFEGKYIITVCAAAAAVLVLYILCGKKRSITRSVKSVSAKLLASAMLFFGVSLCFTAINDLINLREGIYPYPQPIAVSLVGTAMVWLGVLAAFFGGYFLISTAIRWFTQGYTERVSVGLFALLPVLWTWVRILWYMTSFASAANRFRSLFEIAMLLFEMLFLFVFARHLAGMEETAPRFVIPTALSAAMLGFVVCLTRFAAFLMQDAELFGSTALLTPPDVFVAVLAGVFALTQLAPRFYCDEVVAEESPESAEAEPVEERPAPIEDESEAAEEVIPAPVEDEPEVAEEVIPAPVEEESEAVEEITPEPVEEEATPLPIAEEEFQAISESVLTEEAFALSEKAMEQAEAEKEEKNETESEQKPLELEDILNEIINGTR